MRVIHVFKSADGWRWHAVRSGRIVETGAEAYSSHHAVMRAIAAKLRAQYRVA